MARVTIDDCTEKVESRFDLVLFAAHRARQLLEGITISATDSKAQKFRKKTVHSLREIAEGNVVPDELKNALISKMQTEKNIQQPAEEEISTEELPKQNYALEDIMDEKMSPEPHRSRSSSMFQNDTSLHGTDFSDDVTDEEL